MPMTLASPPADGADSFHFAPAEAVGGVAALERRYGSVVSGWDTDPRKMLAPGMKVVFFGQPASVCATDRRDGPAVLAVGSDGPTWSPDEGAAGCANPTQFSPRGPQVAFVADGGVSALRLFTPTGPDDSGRSSFFGPWGVQGQNGRGTNASIQGTFVIFRQAWNGPNALHPWAARADARMLSTQAVRAARVGAAAASGEAVQVKQQMMASVINLACFKAQGGPGHPCQLQYLFNTAVVRAGVSDWSQVSWFDKGNILFDPAQGGVAVVDGPIKRAGVETVDVKSGLGLFTSGGAPTQHGEFQAQQFDVRVSFAQLQNALRVIAARQSGRAVDAVTPQQLVATWGPAYGDPGAWVLLSANVAQEVHNPVAAREASIDGAVRDLSIGPWH